MTYLKGKDGKIKNIEELDSVNNKGIDILYHTTKIETITYLEGKIWHKPSNHKPFEFDKW